MNAGATTTPAYFTTSSSASWAALIATFKRGTTSGGSSATSTYYVHPDHLGGVNAVTDPSGTTVQVADYYPYGSSEYTRDRSLTSEATSGEEYDPETALAYLNARYYNGTQGQFLSQDPVHLAVGDDAQLKALTAQSQQAYLSDPGSLNSYAYAKDNPITKSDPSGLFDALNGRRAKGRYLEYDHPGAKRHKWHPYRQTNAPTSRGVLSSPTLLKRCVRTNQQGNDARFRNSAMPAVP